MRCDGCKAWTTSMATLYASGDRVESYRAPEGKGRCEVLEIETAADFGCTRHDPAPEGFSHARIAAQKVGAPWQHWTMIACPDCKGAGSSGDRPDDRCAGTGKVRLYDDGHVGDERTRMHPRERELAGGPKCAGCGRPVDPAWVACPACGARRETPAEPEVVSQFSTTT